MRAVLRKSRFSLRLYKGSFVKVIHKVKALEGLIQNVNINSTNMKHFGRIRRLHELKSSKGTNNCEINCA